MCTKSIFYYQFIGKMALRNDDLYKKHDQLIRLKKETYEKLYNRCKSCAMAPPTSKSKVLSSSLIISCAFPIA